MQREDSKIKQTTHILVTILVHKECAVKGPYDLKQQLVFKDKVQLANAIT
jgi:hypothetical protein